MVAWVMPAVTAASAALGYLGSRSLARAQQGAGSGGAFNPPN